MIPEKIKEEMKTGISTGKTFFFEGAFTKFFDWNQLEKLLNLRPFNTNIIFMPVNVNTNELNWRIQAWMAHSNCYPPSMINELIRNKICYYRDASRVNEYVNEICREIENTFSGFCADAHIYFTLSESEKESFGIHYDFSHNLIIQMEGETNFKAWNINGEGGPRCNVKHITQNPDIDVILKPGDSVFVPKHFYHQAISLTKRLSISFPFNDNDSEAQERFWIRI